MVGSFRGVLIFIYFVVDLAIFPPTKINAYSNNIMVLRIRVHDDGRGHKHRDSAANTFQC